MPTPNIGDYVLRHGVPGIFRVTGIRLVLDDGDIEPPENLYTDDTMDWPMKCSRCGWTGYDTDTHFDWMYHCPKCGTRPWQDNSRPPRLKPE